MDSHSVYTRHSCARKHGAVVRAERALQKIRCDRASGTSTCGKKSRKSGGARSETVSRNLTQSQRKPTFSPSWEPCHGGHDGHHVDLTRPARRCPAVSGPSRPQICACTLPRSPYGAAARGVACGGHPSPCTSKPTLAIIAKPSHVLTKPARPVCRPQKKTAAASSILLWQEQPPIFKMLRTLAT